MCVSLTCLSLCLRVILMYPFLQVRTVDDIVRQIHAFLAPSDSVTIAMTCRRERRSYIVENPVDFTKAVFIPVVAARYGYRSWLFWWFTEVWEPYIAPFWASDREATDEVLHRPFDSIAIAACEAGHPGLAFLAAGFMQPTRTDWEMVEHGCLDPESETSTPCRYPTASIRMLLDAGFLYLLPSHLHHICTCDDPPARPRNFAPLVEALRAYDNDEIMRLILPHFLFDAQGRPFPPARVEYDAVECIWHCMGGDEMPIEQRWRHMYDALQYHAILRRCAELWPETWLPRVMEIQRFEATRDRSRSNQLAAEFARERTDQDRVGRALGTPWYI
jgi:hypothetical protein